MVAAQSMGGSTVSQDAWQLGKGMGNNSGS